MVRGRFLRGVLAMSMLMIPAGDFATATQRDDPPDGEADTGGGEDGQSEPAMNSGEVVNLNLNPSANCIVGDGQDIHDVLACMSTPVDGPERDADDFQLRVKPNPPPWGVEVRKVFGDDLDHMRLFENARNITYTRIFVDTPGLRARILAFQEDPVGGRIVLTINGDVIEFNTGSLFLKDQAIEGLMFSILNLGYAVKYRDGYVEIFDANLGGSGITEVSLLVTDPALRTTELILERADAKRFSVLVVGQD